MIDADCTPGREPRSVATSSVVSLVVMATKINVSVGIVRFSKLLKRMLCMFCFLVLFAADSA